MANQLDIDIKDYTPEIKAKGWKRYKPFDHCPFILVNDGILLTGFEFKRNAVVSNVSRFQRCRDGIRLKGKARFQAFNPFTHQYTKHDSVKAACFAAVKWLDPNERATQ